jgi:hypothetical protein
MKRALICDLDGTLAHMANRGPFDWDKVYSDTLDIAIADLLRRYGIDHTILLVSGRSDECRDLTLKWLLDNRVFYDLLFMRKQGDYRKDSEVKCEIYRKYIEHQFDVTFCLDDRDQVVTFWREIGLKCYQVAPGKF